MRVTALATAATVFLLASCAEPPAPSHFVAVGDVKTMMAHVLEPAADKIWDSAWTIITADGEEDLSPTTDEGWHDVEHAAAVVVESGNLLLLPERLRDAPDWIEISQGLTSVGQRVLAAAEAQDADALFKTGGELYNVCVSCHQFYWTEGNRRVAGPEGQPSE